MNMKYEVYKCSEASWNEEWQAPNYEVRRSRVVSMNMKYEVHKYSEASWNEELQTPNV